MDLHRHEFHSLEREASLHEDSHPTQEVIRGLALDKARAGEGTRVFPVLKSHSHVTGMYPNFELLLTVKPRRL